MFILIQMLYNPTYLCSTTISLGSIKNLRHFNGKEIVSGYEYKYDRRGNQVEKNEGEGTTKYYYDALSRIKTAVMPEGSIQNYEYDDLDNISKLAEIQGNKIEETSYTYDKNSRLLLQETENGSELKQNRFSYDLNGNQLGLATVFRTKILVRCFKFHWT